MNSYNENLHSSVVSSLQSQELDLKTIDSEANAAMFALYYAQEATLSAADKLQEAKTRQGNAEIRKKLAVSNSNISINLLKSAGQANQYLQQSVNNTAIAASNMQVAANAILKLASDVGSVYNIAQAADLDTDIAHLVNDANSFITKSAYDAELASQLAMEASVLTSQVSAAILLDKAKSTNNSMNDLLKIVTTDYDAKSQVVSADNATFASDRVNEKAAEGVYEDINVVSKATTSAYESTNKGLNLGLTAVTTDKKESTSFTVDFDWIRSPFKESDKTPLYPVQQYYIIVVKDTQKGTFSIHNADDIIQNYPYRCINANVSAGPLVDPSASDSKHVKSNLHSLDLKRLKSARHHFTQTYNYLEIGTGSNKYALQDSDGDELTTGTLYTVFVMAIYQEEYKKKLNTFDDFLSAPSLPFCLTYQLAKAHFESPQPIPNQAKSKENVITFLVAENPDYDKKVEYRCVLLPVSKKVSPDAPVTSTTLNGLVTTGTLKELDAEIEELKKLATKIDPEIASLNTGFLNKESKIELAKQHHIHFFEHIENYIRKEEKILMGHMNNEDLESLVDWVMKQLKKDQKGLKMPAGFAKDMEKLKKETTAFVLLLLQQFMDYLQLENLVKQRDAIINKINTHHDSKIGFLFNLRLAEQISAGNYLVANGRKEDWDKETKRSGHKTALKSMHDNKERSKQPYPEKKWHVNIKPGTTDNFGNLLVNGQLYIPVILSVSIAEEDNLAKFANAWTGYDSPYTYWAVVK